MHKCSAGAAELEKVQSNLRAYKGGRCRFPSSTTCPASADLWHFQLSHGDREAVCLTDRFDSYGRALLVADSGDDLKPGRSVESKSPPCETSGLPSRLGAARDPAVTVVKFVAERVANLFAPQAHGGTGGDRRCLLPIAGQ